MVFEMCHRENTHVLHQTKEEHRQTAQVRRELQSTASHVSTTKFLLIRLQQLNDLGLDRISGSIETRAQGTLDGLVCEVVRDSLLVCACVDLCQVLGGGNAESQDTNPALAIASSVQHANLQTCESLGHALVNRNLNNVGLVARHGREGAQVAGAVEEVAVESAGSETSRCAHTKDGLQANLRRQVVAKFSGKLDRVLSPSSVPGRVEVSLTTGVSGQVAQTCDILVLRAEQEHIDRHLRFTALNREALVEAVLCLQ
jgi:hypothetical protein